jgi:hypothetical protein
VRVILTARQALEKLRDNLLVVRELADLACKREAVKLQQAQVLNDALSKALYPHEAVMRMVFAKVAG